MPFREYLADLATQLFNSRFDTGKYTYIYNSRAAAIVCKLGGGGHEGLKVKAAGNARQFPEDRWVLTARPFLKSPL